MLDFFLYCIHLHTSMRFDEFSIADRLMCVKNYLSFIVNYFTNCFICFALSDEFTGICMLPCFFAIYKLLSEEESFLNIITKTATSPIQANKTDLASKILETTAPIIAPIIKNRIIP